MMSRSKRVFIERISSEYHRPSGPLWQPAVDIYRCPEGWKIKFGKAHFDAIGVDYAFGDAPKSLIEPSA